MAHKSSKEPFVPFVSSASPPVILNYHTSLFRMYSFNKSGKSINQGKGGCYPLNKVGIPEGTE